MGDIKWDLAGFLKNLFLFVLMFENVHKSKAAQRGERYQNLLELSGSFSDLSAAGVMGGCGPPDVSAGIASAPLEEREVLFFSEPSLRPLGMKLYLSQLPT